MKKLLLILALLSSSLVRADLTNQDIFIFDSAGNAINLGQTTMANGLPVSLASNQSAIPVSQSGSWTNACTQSTAASLSGAWPVKVTDGTNTMPTMDVAARAGFFKLTDGTNTQPTGDVASRKIFTALTDGTNTTAVKAGSTAATASDPSAVVALSPNSPVPAGTNIIGALSNHQSTNVDQLNGNTINTGAGATGTGTARVASNAYDGSGNAITSDSPGSAGNQRLHVATPDTTTSSIALGALNAAVSISMSGLVSSGFQLSAGTLIGTLTPEASVDGGTTWTTAQFYNPSNQSVLSSLTFGSANTLTIYGVIGFPGISNVRVRVSAYTSGTANALLRAATVTGSSPSTVISAAFGTISNTTVSMAGNTATLLIAANSNRKYLAVSNNSGSTMQIQFSNSPTLTATTGLTLPARSYYEFKGDNLWTGTVYGFSGSAITVVLAEGTP